MAHKRRLCVLKGRRKPCSEISEDLVHSPGSTGEYSLHGHELCSPKINFMHEIHVRLKGRWFELHLKALHCFLEQDTLSTAYRVHTVKFV